MSDRPRARRAVTPPVVGSWSARSRVRAPPLAGPPAARGWRRFPVGARTLLRKSIKSKPFGSRPTYPAPHDAEPARIAAGARRPITKPVAGRSAAASTRDTAGSHDSRPGLAMIVQVTRRPFPCCSRHRRPWSGHGAVPRRRRKSALAAPVVSPALGTFNRTNRVADFLPQIPRATTARVIGCTRTPMPTPCHAASAIGGMLGTDVTYGPPSAAHKSGYEVQERSCC